MKLNPYNLILMTALVGCTQYVEPPHPSVSLPLARGVYHRVAPGETLWRIATHYGVEVERLATANQISDTAQIEVGQRLLIPGRSSRPDPLVPTPLRDVGRIPEGQDEFVWPVRGKIVSVFGMRRGGALNKGIDIQASGGTQVMASRGGIVSFVHQGLPGFGKTVILDHGDGFATVYAYIGEILVRQGEVVSQRQVIARVGKSGRTEVPALHFEIRYHQRPKNPFYYLSLNLRKGYAADAVV